MYCNQCGAEIEEGASYCESCGALASQSEAPAMHQENLVDVNKENFYRWMEIQFGTKQSYHKRMCKVLEFELDEKLPGNDIGNLFRITSYRDVVTKIEMIKGLRNWVAVNKSIGSGTASAALSRYKLYVGAKEKGIIGDLDIGASEENVVVSSSSHVNHPLCEQINCLDGLIDLIVGDGRLNDKDKCVTLARYMVQQSYFFDPKKVNQRHEVMLQMLDGLEEKMPARFSTASNPSPYYDFNNEPLYLNKDKAISISKNDKLFYKFNDEFIPVLIDTDGNRHVRRLINSVAGRVISQGRKSDFKYATISHIWGNAFNPILFTNLWNIVIVPTYLNPILDKSDDLFDSAYVEHDSDATDFYTKAVNYVNAYFKKLCYQMYGLEDKLADYRSLGFDCSGLVTVNSSISVDMGNVQNNHLL